MLCDQSHGALTSTDEEGVGHEGLEVVDLLGGLLSIKLAELKFDSLKKKNTGKVKKKASVVSMVSQTTESTTSGGQLSD